MESKRVMKCDRRGKPGALKSKPGMGGICMAKRQDTDRSVHSFIAAVA
jgi:hypothetical protein